MRTAPQLDLNATYDIASVLMVSRSDGGQTFLYQSSNIIVFLGPTRSIMDTTAVRCNALPVSAVSPGDIILVPCPAVADANTRCVVN